MHTENITQRVLFPDLFAKPVVACFDQPSVSSDGGAVLLKGLDQRMELTENLARCLREARQSGKISHPLIELVRQRVYGLACGYADGNDAARLAPDPVHKLLVERDPSPGRIWPLSPPCPALRTRSARRNSTGWERLWPSRSSNGTAKDWGGGLGAHPGLGPDRRPHPRGPAAELLQRPL